jgi:hypothetical protein
LSLLVGVEDAAGDGLLVAAAGEHQLALLALHDGGAGVLAHGQHAAGGDVGVLQQVEGHEAVVGRRLGVVEDRCAAGQVAGPQVVGDVVHRLGGQGGERLIAAVAIRTDTPVLAADRDFDALARHTPLELRTA